MYHPFFQFVLPRLGQVALDALLYLNFLQLPPLQLVARWPVLYYGLPLVLMGVRESSLSAFIKLTRVRYSLAE